MLEIRNFKPGDEVLGDLSGCGWGGFAEYVCAPEKALALKPADMTFEQAAAIPQAAALALQRLSGKNQVQANQKVLINGAGGGTGSFALQIAKLFGAEVTGGDCAAKLDMMKSLGADHVIDFEKEYFTRNGNQYDLILDLMGVPFFDYMRALSPKGRYILVGGSSLLISKVLFLGSLFSLISSRKMSILPLKGIDEILEFFSSGKVLTVIDRSYPLNELAAAMDYFGKRHSKGKVVIRVE